jgi:hypothetical protein
MHNDYCPKLNSPTGLCNWDPLCSLWGRNWIFKYYLDDFILRRIKGNNIQSDLQFNFQENSEHRSTNDARRRFWSEPLSSAYFPLHYTPKTRGGRFIRREETMWTFGPWMADEYTAIFPNRTSPVIQLRMSRQITPHNSPSFRPTGHGYATPFQNPLLRPLNYNTRMATNFTLHHTRGWINSVHLHHFIIFNLHQQRLSIKALTINNCRNKKNWDNL